MQKGKRINRPPSKTGAHSLQRIDSKGKNGSSKARGNDDAIPGIGFHVLASELRTIPLLEISLMTGDHDDVSLFKTIDTESKRLQAIEDLYQIVKAQPKYKNLKEPIWEADTDPIIVIHWLLRKVGPLANGNRWTMDTYKDGNKTRFRLVVYRHYHSQKLEDRERHLPLDFLPGLKKRDQPLHDLIIDIVALVSKKNKIPLWNEDGDFSVVMNDLINQSDTDNTIIERQKTSYSTGPAAEYASLIIRRREIVTIKSVEKRLRAYDDKSQRKQEMMWWVKRGLWVASTGQEISGNSFIPHHISGNPVTPYRLYKFIWSLHDNDLVKRRTYSIMTKDEKKYGGFIPVMFSITHPGEIVKPIKEDRFPEILYSFLDAGIKLLVSRYQNYYYKKQLMGQMTPSEQLLEKIEIMELKQAI